MKSWPQCLLRVGGAKLKKKIFTLFSVLFIGPRPIPPDVFNEVQLRQEILEYYRSHHRSPGEPLFVPDFRHTHAITQQCPREEQLRREEVERSQLFVRVLFNNQEVSQTKKG